MPPTLKRMIAMTKAQKYRSHPKPKGCSGVGARRARRPPRSSSAWLPESATEWTLSASIDPDRVTRKPTNLATAMPRLASRAATPALVPCPAPAMVVTLLLAGGGGEAARRRSPAPIRRPRAPHRHLGTTEAGRAEHVAVRSQPASRPPHLVGVLWPPCVKLWSTWG